MTNAKITWDHIHLRTPNPEGMAQWFEKMLGAEVKRSMQQGKERIDLKLGGANIFIAPIGDGENVNAAPKFPIAVSITSDLPSAVSTRSPRVLKPRASNSPRSRPRCGPACAFVSSRLLRVCRSNCSIAIRDINKDINSCRRCGGRRS